MKNCKLALIVPPSPYIMAHLLSTLKNASVPKKKIAAAFSKGFHGSISFLQRICQNLAENLGRISRFFYLVPVISDFQKQ